MAAAIELSNPVLRSRCELARLAIGDRAARLMIKCFHDYSAMVQSSTFMSHSNMKIRIDSQVEKSVFHLPRSH